MIHSRLIEVYQQQVQALVRDGVPFRISNRTVAHAAILLEAVFATAKQEVRLFCGSFDENFYSNERLKTSVIDFLHKPGTRLLVLSEVKLPAEHKMLQALQPYLGSKAELRYLTVSSPNSKHFAVMDRVGYRFEFSHDATDVNVVEAVANFNEPETASKLADSFDAMYIGAQGYNT